MSNFICPTCGFKNIDCGKDGYKTDREVELEKDIDRLSDRNAKLEKKLHIAVKALEEYADPYKWDNCIMKFIAYDQQEIVNNGCFTSNGFEKAQEALAKIKEIK